MCYKEKGFTLVELIIVLGIVSIIICLSFNFFMSTYNSYIYINNSTELQFQAQYILNFMSNRIMESSYIELARDNIKSHLKKSGEQKITKISFRYGEDANQCYIFEIKNNNKIFYDNGCANDKTNIELGAYIDEITVIPVPDGTWFEDAQTITIKLKLTKEQQIFEAEQTICMRNNEKSTLF